MNIKRNQKGKNNSNWKGGKPKCINCGKELSGYGAKRCRKCYLERLKNPRNNSNYIDNRTNKKYFCIDCGKKISYGAKRCHSCDGKRRIGKNSNNYKTGNFRKTKIYYCIEPNCHKTVSQGKRRCNFHASKKRKKPDDFNFINKTHTKETKRKMKTTLRKHHIYLRENRREIIKLTVNKHRQIHARAYHYIYAKYGKKGIDNYIRWFNKKYGLS